MSINSFEKSDFINLFIKQVLLATRIRVCKVSLNKFRWNKISLFGMIDCHLIHYPSPLGLTYAWRFCSLVGMFTIIRMITGVLFPLAHSLLILE
jgi:hypothetical protein